MRNQKEEFLNEVKKLNPNYFLKGILVPIQNPESQEAIKKI